MMGEAERHWVSRFRPGAVVKSPVSRLPEAEGAVNGVVFFPGTLSAFSVPPEKTERGFPFRECN